MRPVDKSRCVLINLREADVRRCFLPVFHHSDPGIEPADHVTPRIFGAGRWCSILLVRRPLPHRIPWARVPQIQSHFTQLCGGSVERFWDLAVHLSILIILHLACVRFFRMKYNSFF